MQLSVEPLNPTVHRRELFDCGVHVLNEFLRTRARKEMEAGASVCFVMVPENDRSRILGFYTLSAATIVATDLPEPLRRKLPRYSEFPATLIGRLARDLSVKGLRIGERLLFNALHRAVAASREVGALAVTTDPKDSRARDFYLSLNFQRLNDYRLFITMNDAAALISDP